MIYNVVDTLRRVGDWTFLTNHARVLVYLAETPGARLREIAVHVGLTERATHRIVSELVADGYLTRHKVGARNFYELHADQPLRLPGRQTLSVGDLLRVLLAYPDRRRARRPAPSGDDRPS